jgi:phenylpyruvate tautomerase
MPYLIFKSNMKLSEEKRKQLFSDFKEFIINDLGKSEQSIMLACQDNISMVFAGTDDPLAFLELRSLRLPEEKTKDLSKAMTGIIRHNLEIPPERIFVNFFNVLPHMWGYNGSTF